MHTTPIIITTTTIRISTTKILTSLFFLNFICFIFFLYVSLFLYFFLPLLFLFYFIFFTKFYILKSKTTTTRTTITKTILWNSIVNEERGTRKWNTNTIMLKTNTCMHKHARIRTTLTYIQYMRICTSNIKPKQNKRSKQKKKKGVRTYGYLKKQQQNYSLNEWTNKHTTARRVL